MPTRALILAIENYSNATTLAQTLAGTDNSADQYFRWLTSFKGLTPSDVWICTGGVGFPATVRKFGTTRSEIAKAIQDLVNTGRNTTSEFYCFISGHGFCYPTRTALDPMDIFVCSDFVDPGSSGSACIRLQELQQKIAHWMGGESHYYFSDACRTVVPDDQIDPSTLGLALTISDAGFPAVSSLFSTVSGNPAAIDSEFSDLLFDGLCGKGRAKGWVNGTDMWVLFDLLADYVKRALTNQEASSLPGSGQGRIYKLPQIPKTSCHIEVQNAIASDTFHAQLLLHGVPFITQNFAGRSTTLVAPPDLYQLEVNHPTATVVQVKPPAGEPIDLYDSSTVQLQKIQGPVGWTGGPPDIGPSAAVPSLRPPSMHSRPIGPFAAPNFSLQLPAATQARLHNLQTGKSTDFEQSFSTRIEPGLYKFHVLESGRPIHSQLIRIDPEERVAKNLFNTPVTKTHSKILTAISGAVDDGSVEFSDDLGKFADRDMGLWLALIGASRILDSPERFGNLQHLPLETFETLPPEGCCVYALVALDDINGAVRVALGDSASNPFWQVARAVPDVPGLFELRIDTPPGMHYISVEFPGSSILTYPVYCCPNRVSLVTFSQDAVKAGENLVARDNRTYLRHLRMYQHNLPLHRFIARFDALIRPVLQNKMNLITMRSLYIIESQYCSRYPVPSLEGQEIGAEWRDILDAKWLDPLSGILGCYELVRAGLLKSSGPVINKIVNALRQSYPGIPDTEAIAKLAGMPEVRPKMPPIFLDGFLLYSDDNEWQTLPLNKIDYSSPWTEWKGGVRIDEGLIAPNSQSSPETSGTSSASATG
jgi:hypothetical protein